MNPYDPRMGAGPPSYSQMMQMMGAPSQTGQRHKFKEGDEIIGNQMAGRRYCATSTGWKGKVVRAGEYDFDAIGFDGQPFTDLDYEFFDLLYHKKETPKKIELNFDHLEKLVITPEAKEEISSVLKQHKHQTKLFEEWGLGETIEYGKGMTFMFYGPPGTGKTWGAHCIAKVIGRELLTISASQIQTSEPGGANRNIENAFTSAREQDKILFLDECDSLITQREAVGMVLGSEINTLLTEIEKFEGVVILATNRIDTLDAALERRISLIIEFPEPTFEQRQEIWKTLIPKKMPLSDDVKVETLAEYKLTGGQIKNCVLQAARLALSSEAKAVEFRHFESAIQRVQKSKNLMGTASRWRTAKVKDDFSKGAS